MNVRTLSSSFATLTLFLFEVTSLGFLDINDFRHSKLDISIQSKPVLLHPQHGDGDDDSPPTESDDGGSVDRSIVLSSKYGQMYQCSLPETDSEERLKESSAREDIDVLKLLAPLKERPCLFYTKGWWTYEFCYGREVQQYHFENGEIQGVVISLGHFESDFNWTEISESEKSTGKVERPFHSQYYTNGSICDLTGILRRTEVRFKCDQNNQGLTLEQITEIEEPSTCTYRLVVSTPRLCTHPRFRPYQPPKAKPITCHPALTRKEYDKYLKLQEKTALRVKELGEKLKSLSSVYEEKKARLSGSETPANGASTEENSSPNHLSPTVEKFFKEVYSTKKSKRGRNDHRENVPVDKEDKRAQTPESNNDGLELDAKEDRDVPSNGVEDGRNEEIEDDPDLAEFRREASTLTTGQKREAKTTFASVLKGQFQEIYDEAKEELSRENEETFKDDAAKESAALETLTKTLTKLLDQLDKTEKKLDDANADLKKTLKAKQEKWWRRHEETAKDRRVGEEGKITKDAEEELEDWIRRTVDKKEGADDDNRVKVRITKISQAEPGSKKPKDMRSISIEDEEQRKLSKAVQEELEKAGLDAHGRRVEVRIVTSGFFKDDDKDGVHSLSEADSSEFRSMLSSLIGANSQQINEEYRKSTMKSNYKFVWRDDDDAQSENAVEGTTIDGEVADSSLPVSQSGEPLVSLEEDEPL